MTYETMDLIDLEAAHLAACAEYQKSVEQQVQLYSDPGANPVAQRETNNRSIAILERIDEIEALIKAHKDIAEGQQPPQELKLFGRLYRLTDCPL